MADLEKLVGTTNLLTRFRDLLPLSGAQAYAKPYAEYISLAPATPLGHLREVITASAITLDSITNWPTGVKKIDFYNLSEDTFIYFTDLAGQSPSSALGFPIPPQGWVRYDNDVNASEFRLATGTGSAALAIATYA